MTTEYTPNFGLALPDFRMGPWHDLLNDDLKKIDQIMFGAMSQVDIVTWMNGQHYIPGVSVLDPDSATTWMCSVEHDSALTGSFEADRIAHPTYWVQLLAGFAPRGQWTQNTNYFPYDLVYDGTLGIMALCSIRHVSTTSGNIKTDEAFWEFLIDMSAASLATAVAVTYSNGGSGIPSTNVQGAIDYLQSEVVALNNVNITQGTQITNLTNTNNTQDTSITGLTTRMGTAESTNNTQDTNIASNTSRITALEGIISGGAFFAAGTKMVFYQAAAPTGWTKVTTDTDKLLRVVSGAGGGSGGTNPFSTVNAQVATGNHVLDITEIPSHTHPGFMDANAAATAGVSGGGDPRYGRPNPTGAAGGGLGHSHPVTMAIQYIDVIVASKN